MKILKSIVIFSLLFSIINCRCSSSEAEEDDDSTFNYDDKSASKKIVPTENSLLMKRKTMHTNAVILKLNVNL